MSHFLPPTPPHIHCLSKSPSILSFFKACLLLTAHNSFTSLQPHLPALAPASPCLYSLFLNPACTHSSLIPACTHSSLTSACTYSNPNPACTRSCLNPVCTHSSLIPACTRSSLTPACTGTCLTPACTRSSLNPESHKFKGLS